ncbi:hypothetical protein DNTS_024829 [Danionella cerebrum]|uniref:Transcription factor n=1 Tax=Danionella cerebrum TaxID=2873325 RepID=A0A553QRZ1_9TELE|nr:hypothetical protein DNTS_024829 [Danionella translucida]TRY92743.1 hypothetical protein DNTS_024829 [Danionella translucida]
MSIVRTGESSEPETAHRIMTKDSGLIEPSGEIKLFVNQTPGKPGVLSLMTLHPAQVPGVQQILPNTLSSGVAELLPHVQLVSAPQRPGLLLPYSQKPILQTHTPQIQEASSVSSGVRRNRKVEKSEKGLRHFSMKVCEKVQKKGVTSYNEVAEELVAEFSYTDNNLTHSPREEQVYEQKNIRRRVYDALNVLMAINIISKEKKQIKWVGFPTNTLQECQDLEMERQRRLERIKQKHSQLQDLILQQVSFKRLVQRNRECELRNKRCPPANAVIPLPFILLNTSRNTLIDCSIADDKWEYLFNFNNSFEIHDDVEVLKRLGLTLGLESGRCDSKQLEIARTLLPKTLEPYITEMAERGVNPLEECSWVCSDGGASASRVETPTSNVDDEEEDDEMEDEEEYED